MEKIFDKITSRDTFAQLIGMKLMEIKPGFARTSISITERMVNMHQVAHGGAIFSVADQACEAAGNSLGEPAVALQHGIHFLAPGRPGEILEAIAKVTHRSNRIGLIEFEVRNQEGTLIATGQQVIYFTRLPDKKNPPSSHPHLLSEPSK